MPPRADATTKVGVFFFSFACMCGGHLKIIKDVGYLPLVLCSNCVQFTHEQNPPEKAQSCQTQHFRRKESFGCGLLLPIHTHTHTHKFNECVQRGFFSPLEPLQSLHCSRRLDSKDHQSCPCPMCLLLGFFSHPGSLCSGFGITTKLASVLTLRCTTKVFNKKKEEKM